MCTPRKYPPNFTFIYMGKIGLELREIFRNVSKRDGTVPSFTNVSKFEMIQSGSI